MMIDLPEPYGQRALVTGVTGQDGSYLAELLLGKGYEVWGMVRRSSSANTARIEHLLTARPAGSPRLHLRHGDLYDSSSIVALLKEIRPHEVYNLGAQSHVKVSFEAPESTAEVTGLGALRVLQAIRELGLESRCYQASSSEMFGLASESPQTETTPFHPRSPYAAAKAFAFHLARNYREAYGMFVANGILFNHESPRRGESFVTRKITLAAARIVQGRQECLYLGSLDARRDWGFAGDYVEAMWRMLQTQTPADYVIATGQTHSVREFCSLAFAQAGLPLKWTGQGADEHAVAPDGRVVVRIDPKFLRPAEVGELRGDAGKARQEIGWTPSTGFQELVRMMVQHDMEGVRREQS